MASLVWVHVVDAEESVIMEPWVLKKMYPMMILKTMITKMELFMTIDRGYILDMARILGLSLYYVKVLFLDWFYVKNILYYWFNIREMLQCKIFF